MKKKKIYRSRISVLVFGSVLILFIVGFLPPFREKMNQEPYVAIGILLFVILFFTGNRYVISGDKLLIKTWFIPGKRINIKEITSLERSYNPISSPAASLKRLQISFEKGCHLLISPVNEKQFVEELKLINPHIYINIPDKKGRWRIQDWDI